MPNRSDKPLIAVTSGDPAGIGPEITARLFAGFAPTRSRAIVIGSQKVFSAVGGQYGFKPPVVGPGDDMALGAADAPVVLLDTAVVSDYPLGQDSRGGGEHAGRAIETACNLAMKDVFRAIVTAPISKKSLNLADFPFAGHTEMLARYLIAPQCQMMMVHESFRVVPLTRHLPLRDVADSISEDGIVTCVRETASGLRSAFGVDSPSIAVAGLNPHSGDNGLIGSEELDIIVPALARLRDAGITVTGPVPADAMFQSVFAEIEEKGRPRHDAYVTMYHDQGLIPFKMLARRRGVNVTIGLPVVRTSVDHGVAYDIAGQGRAEIESLREAYNLAEELCRR